MNHFSKKRAGLLAILLLPGFVQPVWAAGPPQESLFSNTLALTLLILMAVLLIVIGVLASILVGLADLKVKKKKRGSATGTIIPVLLLSILSSTSLFAQTTGGTTSPAVKTIDGMDVTAFYIMIAVIFVELTTIIALLINIKFILKEEKIRITAPEELAKAMEAKKSQLSWWDKFNKLRPVTQEAELDLGHDYDGIRELNNKLPPWWLYGFYLTIVFAGIYLWRHHVSHTAPLSAQEYDNSIQQANLRINNYLKTKGENINENTVVLLTAKADLDAGKELFTNGACIGCHGKDGSGIVMGQPGVGPNLTDEYWINGGNIKNLFTTIKYGGRSGKGMQAWGNTYSAKQIAQLASYIKSLHGTNPVDHKGPDGVLYQEEEQKPAADSSKTGSAKKP